MSCSPLSSADLPAATACRHCRPHGLRRALELAKKYGQHSVITREGLVRAGNWQVFPSRGFGVNQDATDYYSEILDEPPAGAKYQFDFPDEAFHPAMAAPTTASVSAADAHPPTQPS